jgi:hypothetical protein
LKLKLSTYELVFDRSLNYESIYEFVMNNFGPDRIDELIKLFGKEFIDCMIEKKMNLDKLFEANSVVCEFGALLEKSTDPIVLAMALIGKLRSMLVG